MSTKFTHATTGLTLLTLLYVSIVPNMAQAADSPRPIIATGLVTGDDVYVRSGAGQNYYPITKLNAGVEVRIVGEKSDWYEIVPPEQCYSLISGEYVDRGQGQLGVVNGDNVNVRAGSLLTSDKYAVQTQLSRGDEVSVLGENPDGFLRIAPPKNAGVYISRDYVETVPGSSAALHQERGTAIPENDERSTAGEDSRRSDPDGTSVSTGDPTGADAPSATGTDASTAKKASASNSAFAPDMDSPWAGLAETPQRRRLMDLDAQLEGQMAKPVLERQLDSLITEFKSVADQKKDELAREYAAKRVAQLEASRASIETVRSLRDLDSKAQAMLQSGATTATTTTSDSKPKSPTYAARGELVASAIFTGGDTPARLRLVDPSTPERLTVGYVEIAQGSGIDVRTYLGQFVGVKAERAELLEGVRGVPVYYANELVMLDRPGNRVQASSPARQRPVRSQEVISEPIPMVPVN